jgi:hypothetical protein
MLGAGTVRGGMFRRAFLLSFFTVAAIGFTPLVGRAQRSASPEASLDVAPPLDAPSTDARSAPVGVGTDVQEARVDLARVERLDAWLAHQRDEMRFARRVVGPLSLATGALMLVPGVYGLADGVWDEQPNLGWLAFGVAGLGLAQGVVWMAIQSDPEERFARWRAAREAGLTATELARFEGELRGTPSLARMERALIRWSGIGLVFGGGLYAGLLALDDPPTRHRVLGYAASSIYGAVGIVLLVYASIPELGETSWRRYEAGELPETPRVRAQVTPSAGCDRWGCSASLTLQGTFVGR